MAGQWTHRLGAATLADAVGVAEARAQRITFTFDETTRYYYYDKFGKADKLVFETGRDDATPIDNFFFFDLNDREFAGNAKWMTIDARALGGQMNGQDGLFEEIADVTTTHVTKYTIRFLGGAGGDRVDSGVGGDTMQMGAGDDYVSIGSGDDVVRSGKGADRIESSEGDLNAGDTIDGGSGTDLLIVHAQGLADADMVNFRSIEIIGIDGDGPLTLGANAAAAGVNTLYVDAFYQGVLTIGAGFTGELAVEHSGGDPYSRFRLDASASSATIVFDASYNAAERGPTYIGGSGTEDTIKISNGFSFPGSPPLGGNLRHVSGFEHVLVQDLGGDTGAYVILDTAAGDIAAAYQSVDASQLGAGKSFRMRASDASADLHVLSGGGDDLLASGSGDDRIEGGLGKDRMTGGAGGDVFVYRAAADSSGKAIDTIGDFASGSDTIDVTGIGAGDPSLRGATINFLGNQADATGLAASAGNGVLDAVYRTDTHSLWFDVNDDGKYDAGDLHIAMGSTAALTGADVLSGHVIV
jgi:Ca2+-binding RTX toxin-like protein